MSEVCPACTAAAAVGRGVLAVVQLGDLHASCNDPGSCDCGCDYARGVRCNNCRRPRAASQIEHGECVDRAECARAILDAYLYGGTSPTALVASSAPQRGAPRAQARVPAPRGRECQCGCGEMTAGGRYRSGHDAKHLSVLTRRVRAGELDIEDACAMLDPYPALCEKLRKAVA